jgi:hypothetical protein
VPSDDDARWDAAEAYYFTSVRPPPLIHASTVPDSRAASRVEPTLSVEVT